MLDRTHFFYDTEFLERGYGFPIELISIGMVSEDGKEYYAANADFDLAKATPWLKQNVVPYLPSKGSDDWKHPIQIRLDLLDFVGHRIPHLWANYAAYDHVLLTQILGGFEAYPESWPKFTLDIQQWRCALGDPNLPAQGGSEHNALEDARYVKECWQFLTRYAKNGGSKD